MNRIFTFALAAFAITAVAVASPGIANAQCDTCATPTVAYQPVQPVTAVYTQERTGWYPGRLLDRLRMRSWRAQTPATATYTTAAYAPTNYTAAYTPYTASYAPYTTNYTPYTASYTPYVTSYAPLQRVSRPVVLRPVAADTGCTTCSYTPAATCSDCGVAQAAYSEPVSGCSNCEASSSVPNYSYEDAGNWRESAPSTTAGPATPRPTLEPQADPQNSYYRGESLASARELETLRNRIEQLERERDAYHSGYGRERRSGYRGTEEPEASILKKTPAEEPEAEDGWPGLYNSDNASEVEEEPAASNPYPRWNMGVSERTARGPSVNVWNAVYSKNSARGSQVSTQRSASKAPTQAEIDAIGWRAVKRDR